MGNHNILPQLSYNALSMAENYLIDVRSPGEFNEFHIPNSINLPLFTDEERKVIGTLYKQVSPEEAKKEGIALYAKKLPLFYDRWQQLGEKNKGKRPVVMCARGGMRSAAFVSMMRTTGMEAYQLTGGIRSIREYVRSQLENYSQMQWRGLVLDGNTGTGKTNWLKALKEKGYPVIDLEGLANHRGSVFGHIGLSEQSQKQFEFQLVEELKKYKDNKVIIFEGESKRIGKIVVPEFLLKLKEEAFHIVITDSMENRVERIYKEYNPQVNHEDIITAYRCIRKRIDPTVQEIIDESFRNREYKIAFACLLIHYYDPMYEHKGKNYLKQNRVKLDLSIYKDEDKLALIEEQIVNHNLEATVK